MLKIVKKDYPWTVLIADKIGKNSGKKYQSIGLRFTEKNPNATCKDDEYKSTWLSFFDERDLLKLASTAENAYQALKAAREAERAEEKQQAQPSVSAPAQPTATTAAVNQVEQSFNAATADSDFPF
jgi:hypothetical protein